MPKVNGGGISPASMNAIPYSVPQNNTYRGFDVALNCGDEINNRCSVFFRAGSVEAGASILQSNMPLGHWQRTSIEPEISVPASPAYSALSPSEKKRALIVFASVFDFFSINRKITLAEFCRSNGIHSSVLLHRLRSTGMSPFGKKMILERYGVTHDDLKKSFSAISAGEVSNQYMDVNGQVNIDACDALLQSQANAVIEAQIQKDLSRTIDPTERDIEQDAWIDGLLSRPPEAPGPAYAALLPIERRRVLTIVTCMFDFFPKDQEMTISAFGRSNGIPSTNLFSRLNSIEMLSRGKRMIFARYGVGYDDLRKSVSAVSAEEINDRYMNVNGKVNINACDALLKEHANAIIAARIQK